MYFYENQIQGCQLQQSLNFGQQLDDVILTKFKKPLSLTIQDHETSGITDQKEVVLVLLSACIHSLIQNDCNREKYKDD